MAKIVINTDIGGFGLSDAAYVRLIELGVPVARFTPDRDMTEREVIFDHELSPPGEDNGTSNLYWKHKDHDGVQRYWDTWLRWNRTHPLLVQVVEEMGESSAGHHGKLKIVEVPDDVKWEIADCESGQEWVAEVHRTWK